MQGWKMSLFPVLLFWHLKQQRHGGNPHHSWRDVWLFLTPDFYTQICCTCWTQPIPKFERQSFQRGIFLGSPLLNFKLYTRVMLIIFVERKLRGGIPNIQVVIIEFMPVLAQTGANLFSSKCNLGWMQEPISKWRPNCLGDLMASTNGGKNHFDLITLVQQGIISSVQLDLPTYRQKLNRIYCRSIRSTLDIALNRIYLLKKA